MRTSVVVGNWKMNTTPADAASLARDIRAGIDGITGVTTVVCPPALSIIPVSIALEGSSVLLGAQDVNQNPQGAHTGEMSADMIATVCSYVLIGHSERRTMYGETNETTAAKTRAACAAGLRPIVCVGESLEVRESDGTSAFISDQIKGSLAGVDDISQVMIAYEPLWAIGTGRAASPDMAREMSAFLRGAVADLYSAPVADEVILLYGGSVNSGNCVSFVSVPDVDGALVGGASLNGQEFSRIVELVAT
ncbi:MAG: triose-phosphate isomerase [Chloroflexi bacterium]|nr:triose-phosphate isomerase [Chloroflexota bacterium]